MHYLSTCSGSFARSSRDANFLTAKKVNITCTKRSSGYSFNIADILRSELHPSVLGLADEITQITEYTAPWIALWYIGIVTAIMEMFVFLPLTWPGVRRLNGWSALNSFASAHATTFFLLLISLDLIPLLPSFFQHVKCALHCCTPCVSTCTVLDRVLCYDLDNNVFNAGSLHACLVGMEI